jgi:deoxyribodipyrimidine photolyase-related protein
VPGPARFSEDEIDERVRHDLGRWEKKGEVRLTGQDGPREFAVTGNEAGKALRSFIKNRLAAFGPQQDAMLATDPFMAHSLLSPR